ncbi:MAG: hypothetical protein Kow00107_04680 [Planctomycetota bacterium]
MPEITPEDRRKAESCLKCPVCSHARRKQRGILYWFVKKVESGFCPNCKAYEKVYGRKAHEPIPDDCKPE